MNATSQTRRQFLQSAALAALAGSRLAGAAGTRPPNILFILADDLGYADLGVYGQTDFETPMLDRLAGEGVQFLQAYANSAVCSASRLALITGRYQYRLRAGLEEPIAAPDPKIGLPPTHPTLPSLLKQAGYSTALFGKWHLGFLPGYGPLKSGYDVFFGNYGGAIDYFTHRPDVDAKTPEDLYEGEVPVHRLGYYTDLLADRAVEYIGQRPADQPFFLSLHFTAPHWPWEGPQDEALSRELTDIFDFDGGTQAIYGRMVGALDAAVGRVLATLEHRGLADDTIVIFTSDNGGERFAKTWPFSGQKTELLEGGIRVPCLLRWPRALPRGITHSQVCIGMDWMPTLLAAAGSAPDPLYPSDGMNLLPILRGEQPQAPRTLFWRYKANAQRAMRKGNWKYLKINDNEFLFDVMQDPLERANLAKRQAAVFRDMKNAWVTWNGTMLPIPPKAYSHGVTPAHQADHYAPKGMD